IIDSGVLGNLCEVEIHYDRFNLALSPKQHKEVPNAGAGIVKDLGPHLIDQALFLFGLPLSVFADVRITREVSVVDDYFEILLYYPSHRVR
ncbi:Gfo/Idh/MocA family oxidoreductase, partial [Acinetobacter baumannii]